MMLTHNQILERLARGSIVLEPFNQNQLNNASYDLTLGRYFLRTRASASPLLDGNEIFEEHPVDAQEEGFIVLEPGERVLGHTVEFAGGTIAETRATTFKRRFEAVNCKMQATSTAGRLGVSACFDAGFGDVGYVNRWTLEICNLNRHTVHLPVGAIICQLIFFDVEPPPKLYHEMGGQYQVEESPTWSPEMMKPKRIKVGTARCEKLNVTSIVEEEVDVRGKVYRKNEGGDHIRILRVLDESEEVEFTYLDRDKRAFRPIDVFNDEFTEVTE